MPNLTAMQSAYWVWGHAPGQGEGVSAHLYVEFDVVGIDPARLKAAVDRLFAARPVLGLGVDAEGSPFTGNPAPLLVEDFRPLTEDFRQQALQQRRAQRSHQRLPLDHGQGLQFALSLTGDKAARLHVDLDMIVADPSCFGTIMEDLARAYEGLDLPPAEMPVRPPVDPADRDWWRAQLQDMPDAPDLPAGHGGAPDSTRLSALLTPDEHTALRRIARQQRVTFSAMMLALFTAQLGAATGQARFRLNVPTFLRRPDQADAIGDFSDLTVLAAEAGQTAFADICQHLQDRMIASLSRHGYSGTSVLRDLSRQRGTVQTAPVVFTAGLDLPQGHILGPRASALFGPMVWLISQAPQVSLDVQLASVAEGLLINWDLRRDRVDEGWTRDLLDRFVDAARRLAADPALARLPISAWSGDAAPLTALQKAYLMGRESHLPLGGVAMQKFREYRGVADPSRLRARLTDLVAAMPALRMRIDTQALTQSQARMALPFDETDLRHLSPDQAEAHLDALRDDYAHALFDPVGPLWNVTAFQMPEGCADPLVIFARFDALILDGASICTLLARLFDDAPLSTEALPTPATPPQPEARRIAQDHWTHYLAGVDHAPRLPWRQPLDQLGVSRYGRETLRLPADVLKRLKRVGAGQGLFPNSILTAILLDTLARWTTDGQLCVAVPVTPPGSAAGGNASSFVPLVFDAAQGNLADRAAKCQADMMAGLAQTALSGPEIGRLLMHRHQDPLPLPVVITNGLGWERPAAQPMRLIRGLTQTPQVALDMRLALDAGGELRIDLDFARAALDQAMVRDLLAAIGRALTAVAESGRLALDADPVGLDHYRLNDDGPGQPVPFLSMIAGHLFDADTADRPVLHVGDRTLSRGELADMTARAIGGLRAQGIGAGSVAAIVLPRGAENLAIQLACALEGVIRVPIEASSPPDRLDYLLQTCSADLVVTDHTLLLGDRVAPATDQLDRRSLSDAPAFYLFTSGTTGRPKCVVLTNRATANTIGATLQNWQVSPDDRVMSVTPLHHDMSVFDLFGALTAGAAIVMPGPSQDKDAVAWCVLVRRHRVTMWTSVPAILEMLLACRRPGDLDSLRLIAQGGDYIKPATIADLRKLLPDARLFSLGGPTETTIWSIWHEIGPEDTGTVPYGRPLPGNSYFILNDRADHVPTGIVGRIHTAGVNVAAGYLIDGQTGGDDFLTINDDRGQPVRAFRTGDQGYYRDDGVIIFASRVSGYVKVRGVRVSLPDIENALIRHPAIRHVMVVDTGEGAEVSLAAIYVADGQTDSAGLRTFARQHLPESHVPSRFLAVDTLPLSANGKPDRGRARQLVAEDRPVVAEPAAASDTPENRVLAICLGVIGGGQQGTPDAPLLSLGLRPAHLKDIADRLNAAFGTGIAPRDLIRCKTARDVAGLCVLTPV